MPLISEKSDFCNKKIKFYGTSYNIRTHRISRRDTRRRIRLRFRKQESTKTVGQAITGKRKHVQERLLSRHLEPLRRTESIEHIPQNLSDAVRAQRNSAVVTGATPEAEAAVKKVNARALSDTVGNIAAMGQQVKDNAKTNYLNQKNYLLGQKAGQYAQNAASWTQIASNSGNLLGSLFTTPYYKKTGNATTPAI